MIAILLSTNYTPEENQSSHLLVLITGIIYTECVCGVLHYIKLWEFKMCFKGFKV